LQEIMSIFYDVRSALVRDKTRCDVARLFEASGWRYARP
jgi:hypothetical protein